MNDEYLNIYNNIVKLSRNKSLFNKLGKNETFSERIMIFLIHFAFFLKIYKKNTSKNKMQIIYDYVFKQIEISIREIGYGDMSINKKMKNYINTLYSILDKIDNWENLDKSSKSNFFKDYIDININKDYFVNYFEKYSLFLQNNTLKSFSKDVIKTNF